MKKIEPYQGMPVIFYKNEMEFEAVISYLSPDERFIRVRFNDPRLKEAEFTKRRDGHYVLVGFNYGFLKLNAKEEPFTLIA